MPRLDDLLATAEWACAWSEPGAIADPASSQALDALDWGPAAVPGTVAGALRDRGQWSPGPDDEQLLDGRDWWYRARLGPVDGPGPWVLEAGGLATLADLWVAGQHVARSENMFLPMWVSLSELREGQSVIARFSALGPELRRRHPRPRWRSTVNRSQNARWYRTTTLGRNGGWARWAAPVGPWRPITLRSAAQALWARAARLRATCDDVGPGGAVAVSFGLAGALAVRGGGPLTARVDVGGQSVDVPLARGDGELRGEATVRLPSVERWWPHTHGAQPRYPATATVEGHTVELGSVGFRTVVADRSDGGFTLVVNGTPVFARGACWVSPDYVSMAPSDQAVRQSLERARDAGLNLLRLTGTTTYETEEWWDLCDELGLMVWQDCMLANWEPPEDEAWWSSLALELDDALGSLGGRPALAVVCGSSETQQQAAMYGLPRAEWHSPVLDEKLPELVERLLPGIPWLPSTPTGGDLPFTPDQGVAHYFGVGAYLRPPADVASAGVRFAGECLAFSIPPERPVVGRVFDGAAPAGHDPRWKAGVPRDAAAPWDFEDVTNHYVATLFECDPLAVRYQDPERALDLGRAAVTELMTRTFSEWRRPRSACAGAIILSWQDLWPGAGWGLLDSAGGPKAPWWGLRRALAPVAVNVSDDGLAGLRVTAYNDGPAGCDATLSLVAFDRFGAEVERAVAAVALAPCSAVETSAAALLGCFRDLNHAYRFGPPSADVVVARLLGPDGSALASTVHLCGGPPRALDPDVGLAASAALVDGHWVLEVSTTRLAQYVVPELRMGEPEDSWFHLEPGGTRRLALTLEPSERPAGTVRCLNSLTEVPIVVTEA